MDARSIRSSLLALLSALFLSCAVSSTALAGDDDAASGAVQVLGVRVTVDPATGRLRPPTAEERQALAAGIRALLQRDAPAPAQTARYAVDGSVTLALDARHRHYAVAATAGDTLERACVLGSERAAAFLAGETNADRLGAAAGARQ